MSKMSALLVCAPPPLDWLTTDFFVWFCGRDIAVFVGLPLAGKSNSKMEVQWQPFKVCDPSQASIPAFGSGAFMGNCRPFLACCL